MTNPDKCVGCKACEVACVLSHNQQKLPETEQDFLPRIQVVSTQDRYVALTCRHCDDAPCVSVCPASALVVRNGSVQPVEGKCIGCKNCMLACPFGAIDLVLRDHQVSVLKCDLCTGSQTGPACVAACPTNAIELYTQEVQKKEIQQKRLNSLTGQRSDARQQKYQNPIAAIAAIPREEANKKDIEIRKNTFVEIYESFSAEQVSEQGERCLACGEHSFCEWTCPMHNRIPHWIALAKQGRIIEAAELSHQYSSLPEICGRVCPQDRLCEGSCTLKRLNMGSITVGNIERYITDTAFAMGWKPNYSSAKPTERRVAIVGAGPAGLGCADVLTRNGIKAVVFERQPEIGGMLTFGIPAFKLDKEILAHRRELFAQGGIEFHLNTEVGKNVSFQTLLNDYDAVFLGVGTYESMKADLLNENAPGVYEALPYLVANTKNLMGLEQQVHEPYVDLKDQQVVVLGGGDTAMDCVRTALRQQAKSVVCAYRRDEANMPGSKKEVKNAKEEGGEFLFNVQPLEIVVSDQGSVEGIRFIRTELGPADASGRQRPQAIPGSEFVLEAQAIIIAFGFSAHAMPWLANDDVKLNKWGCVVAPRGRGEFCQTSNPKIFAGGDIVRGANLVVNAMADGRRAAQGIVSYLNEEQQFVPEAYGENEVSTL